MLQLSVNELSTMKWNFEEDVVHYHEAGFSTIGIWYPKLARYGEEKGSELLQEYGFSISSLSYVSGFTGHCGVTYRQSILEALDVIQLAADIGAPTVVLVAGSRNGHTRNHALRILRSALHVLAEAAQAVGVQLALEPTHLGCSSDSYLNTIPQCLDVIAEIGSPNLGLNIDIYHVAHDSSLWQWMKAAASLVRLVQLGDAKSAPVGQQNRCPLGDGHLPLLELIDLFQSSRYGGYYEIELQGEGVQHLEYMQLLDHSHQTARQWQLQLA
ncbi:MAG: sugar phosphate isomerase/epimerase [Pirellulaceae bacterium]|nr:sugar phosphate isomerase/epimerase [Pirellulaceae bacterium]